MYHHISSLSKSCFSSIREASETKKHSRLHNCPHYCHISHSLKTRLLQHYSLFFNFSQSQRSRLQLIYSAARAVFKTPKFSHITPVLKSLHWSKLNRSFNIRLSFLPKKLFNPTNLPISITCMLYMQRNRNARSSDIVTLKRPSVCCSLKLTDRLFTHHAPVLWNGLT